MRQEVHGVDDSTSIAALGRVILDALVDSARYPARNNEITFCKGMKLGKGLQASGKSTIDVGHEMLLLLLITDHQNHEVEETSGIWFQQIRISCGTSLLVLAQQPERGGVNVD